MTKGENTVLLSMLDHLHGEFTIPPCINLAAGGGEVRIIASAVLVSPRLCKKFDSALSGGRELADLFRRHPLKSVSLVGGLIAERPLIDEAAFRQSWENHGIQAAVSAAHVNPIFAANIHLLVRVANAYCKEYSLTCESEAPRRHFEHLKPLRYILHASG